MKVIWSIFHLLLILLLMFLLKQCQENTVVCCWIGKDFMSCVCKSVADGGRKLKNFKTVSIA